MDLKRLVILEFLIVTSSLSLVCLLPAFGQTSGGEPLTAETLLSLVEDVNKTVQDTFAQIEAKGISVAEEARIRYQQGLMLAGDAVHFMENGSFREASVKAVAALQEFKAALIIAQEPLINDPTWVDASTEKLVRLQDSITRAHALIHQLDDLSKAISAKGYNTTLLELQIDEAKSFVEKASRHFDLGRVDAALQDLVDAKAVIIHVKASLQNLKEEIQTQRIETFLIHSEMRISALKADVISLANELSPDIQNASLTNLDAAETSLQKARAFLQNGMFNETINEITTARVKEQETINLLQSVLTTNISPDAANATSQLTCTLLPNSSCANNLKI